MVFEEGYGVERIEVGCILSGQDVLVIALGMGPVPDICGIVADGVAVEGLQVVNDGHQVDESLAGVVGQDEPTHHQQGDDEQGAQYPFSFPDHVFQVKKDAPQGEAPICDGENVLRGALVLCHGLLIH